MDRDRMNLRNINHPVSDTTKQPSIGYGVAIGLISAAFFSLTFVLNSAIAQGGGPWQWTASLRYILTIPILVILLMVYRGLDDVSAIFCGFKRRAGYWIFAGSLSCGLFYSGITYASGYMAGWVIAATWQTTIVASAIVVFIFAGTFSFPRLITSLIVLLGVVAVNWQVVGAGSGSHITAFVALLVAAIAYPVGNQLLSIERHRTLRAGDPVGVALQNPLAGILILTLGSVPFWIILLVISRPDNLVPGQLLTILMTTLFAGIVATALFYFARNLTTDPRNITAVDTTQATEVVFAMFLEIIFVRPVIPSSFQILGILLILFGVGANCFNLERKKAPNNPPN